LTESGPSDVSGWRSWRLAGLRRTAAWTAGLLVILAVLIFHLGLWWECGTLAERRRETGRRVAAAFERAFPGQRAVDPIPQTTRLLKDLERRIDAVQAPPRVPFGPLLDGLTAGVTGKARLEKVGAGAAGWKAVGLIDSYAALEALLKQLGTLPGLGRVKSGEAVPVPGERGGPSRLRVTLEGAW